MARITRASELNAFTYCRKAWWYQQHGYPSRNVAALRAGDDLHSKHGRQIRLTGYIRTSAYILIFLGMILILGWFLFLQS